jgi:hypothetical protein
MRKEIDYCIAMDDPELVMKRVIDEENKIYTAYAWGYKTKDWNEAWEVCCPYFDGWESARRVTEEEAMEQIKECTEKKAQLSKG